MKYALLSGIVLAAGSALFAQTPRFTTGTAAVRVDALVMQRNKPVTGLKAADFELRDNGVVQTITDVSYESLPINVICVLDLSGSVRGRPLDQLKDATLAMLNALGGRDRAALVTFSERLFLHTPLTGDRDRLRGLISKVESGGATSMIDAAFAALTLRESDDGRTLMLLSSDGRDTASWLAASVVLDAARRSDVVIYPVTVKVKPSMPMATSAMGSPAMMRRRISEYAGERLLDAFADETGGRVSYAEDEGELRVTFASVLAEFRQRYVLSYTPSGVSGDNWHTLDVRLRGRSGQVKARRGYFADPVSRGEAAKAPPK
jgi:VWFA-related protein